MEHIIEQLRDFAKKIESGEFVLTECLIKYPTQTNSMGNIHTQYEIFLRVNAQIVNHKENQLKVLIPQPSSDKPFPGFEPVNYGE